MSFNYKKTIQIWNFLAKSSNGSIDKLKAIKLVWLADRLHLRKYGRMITNDFYFAMKFGPVGSFSKDYASGNLLDSEEKEYFDKYLKIKDAYTVESIKGIDDDVFSDSDMEVIKEIFEKYGEYSNSSLVDFSHYFPEWEKFKAVIERGDSSRELMDVEDFFKNPKETLKLENIFNENAKDLDIAKKRFEEAKSLEKCWL
ncbi:Panacea domain-containing protein [bacterium]|jgi:uncharacterized phage-associated protein|nr:Panacea domain-containing protein [bacterium]